MQWKDRNSPAEDEDGQGRIDVEAPGYSVLRSGGGGFSLAGLIRTPMALVVLALVAVLLIGVAVMNTGGGDAAVSVERLDRLESQVAQIEVRLGEMGSGAAAAGDPGELQRRIEGLTQRLDRTEAALAQRIAAVERVAKAPVSVAAAKPAPAEASSAAASAPKAKAVFYEVQAGDTLYSISRRANLTVEKLRQLNQLKPDASIHPGDRLKISP